MDPGISTCLCHLLMSEAEYRGFLALAVAVFKVSWMEKKKKRIKDLTLTTVFLLYS